MANFFSNSWVISFITGLLVYFLTKLWERLRERKQYKLAIFSANKEVFDTLKFAIPETVLPSVYVLRALHVSTAKQKNVKQEDMDSLNSIIFDLIKEIMESNFLSYENKIKYCMKLEELEQSLSIQRDDSSKDKNIEIQYTNFYSKKVRYAEPALFMAILAMLISLLMTTTIDKFSFYTEIFMLFYEILKPILLILPLLMVMALVVSKIKK